MEIKINITAPGLEEAINNLAGALQGNNTVAIDGKEVAKEVAKTVSKEKPKAEKPKAKVDDPITAAPVEEKKETSKITLETVRVKLAEVAQAGKQAEAKNLIASFGAKRLSDIPEEKYGELLEKASDL